MSRILNCGFFNLTDNYLKALRELPVCAEVDFDAVRTRTFLPMIDNVSSPLEVLSLVRAAIEVAKPEAEDVVIVSGTPDVVAYVMSLTAKVSCTVLCPLGSHRNGAFALQGFREVMRAPSDEAAKDALFHLTEES